MGKTVKELRIIAKELNIKGYYKMKKADLVVAIAAAKEVPAAPAEEVKEDIKPEVIPAAEKVEFKPQNTAIVKGNSYSAKVLAEEVKEGEKILDYGCGSGRNIKYISSVKNIQMYGLDIAEQIEKERQRHNILRSEGHIIEKTESNNLEGFDKVLNSHVLNVVESDEVKDFIVKDIYNKLKNGGKAYFEVRTKNDVESAKTKERYGEGWKIKKGKDFTYQEGITKDKMTKLLTSNGFKIVNHICNSSRHLVVVTK